MTEYDFYISENKAIRTYFENKYGKQYSKDGVYNPKVMFSVPNRLRVVYLLKENYNEAWNPYDNLENEYVHSHQKITAVPSGVRIYTSR